MKEQSIKKNYLFHAGYQLLALMVPLITTPYISRVLGASQIGIYSYSYSIVSYFLLFSALGTAAYASRMLGVCRDNEEERSIKFWEIFLLRFILSSISIFIYLFYVLLYADDKMIAGIQAIHIIGVAVDVAWFFQGMEDFQRIAVRNFVIKIINIIFIFVFVKDRNDLWLYVFGISFWTLLANAALWISLRRYVIFCSFKKLHPFKDIFIILQLFIPAIAVQIYAILDKSMIGWISKSSVENGYYEQAEKIVKMCLMLITALGTVTIPKISREHARGNYDIVSGLIYRSSRFVWFLGAAMMFGLIGINQKLVPVFFGSGYDKVMILLPILSTLFLLMGLNNVIGVQYMISTGRQKIYMYIIITGGAVNLLCNTLLIPRYASSGAAVGSVAGEVIILVLGSIYIYIKKVFSVKRMFAVSKNYLISGIIMLLVIYSTKNYFSETLSGLILIIAEGGVCYLLILILLRDEFVIMGLKGIHTKISGYRRNR